VLRSLLLQVSIHRPVYTPRQGFRSLMVGISRCSHRSIQTLSEHVSLHFWWVKFNLIFERFVVLSFDGFFVFFIYPRFVMRHRRRRSTGDLHAALCTEGGANCVLGSGRGVHGYRIAQTLVVTGPVCGVRCGLSSRPVLADMVVCVQRNFDFLSGLSPCLFNRFRFCVTWCEFRGVRDWWVHSQGLSSFPGGDVESARTYVRGTSARSPHGICETFETARTGSNMRGMDRGLFLCRRRRCPLATIPPLCTKSTPSTGDTVTQKWFQEGG